MKKYTAKQWIVIVISLLLCFGSAFISPLWGLSPAGFRVLCIFIGTVLFWLFVATDWTSLLVLMALMMVPELGVKTIAATSFGNDTAVFLLICFMLAACLTKTGLAKRISIWFITNKLGRKSPWWTIVMYFCAEFVMSLVLSNTTSFLIFLPIMVEILEGVGYRKEDKPQIGAAMILGSVLTGSLANSCTPISHAISITGMSLYTTYTGESIDFLTFCAVLMPVAIVGMVIWLLFMKYIWKPDVSKFVDIDYDAMKASCGQITKREKAAAIIYVLVLVFWIIPGIVRYVSPDLYKVFSLINQNYPPLIAIFLMNLIWVDGAPILSFKESYGSANWNTYLFIATVMCLGTCISNASVGLNTWLAGVFTPIAETLSPSVFIIVMCILGMILTNFISNGVGVSVIYAIAMPLTLTVYAGQIIPMNIAILVTAAVQYAWATPGSTPNAVVASNSGWIEMGTMVKRGFFVLAFIGIAFLLIGIPLGNLLCH